MRLWHYKLIPFLPNSQLVAQWRELNSIFKKQDKHILINYIYEYTKANLYAYSVMVIREMKKRNYKIKSLDNFNAYFNIIVKEENFIKAIMKDGRILVGGVGFNKPFWFHHNDRYLIQCFFNLQEKYERGQKDFKKETYIELEKFIRKEVGNCENI